MTGFHTYPEHTPKKGAAIRSQVLQEKADRFTTNVLPIIRELKAEGITNYKALARALNGVCAEFV